MLNKRKVSKFIICLLINIAIACIAIFVFGTQLNINDDNVISYITYGIQTEASSRVYYTNVILGWMYKHLFAHYPCFNWQTLTYYLGLIFSGTICLSAVLNKKNVQLAFLWSMFMVTFFHDVYIDLTFSVVAGFVGCQGYMAMFLTIEDEEKDWLMYVLSGMCILYSSMVRIDSFFSISGFAFFAWLSIVFVRMKKTCGIDAEIFKTYFYPFIIVIGICFLIYGVDRMTYMKGEWKEYKVHEDATSIITDSRTALNEQGIDAFEDEGINKTMALAILGWRNNDPEVLTTDVMKTINSTADDYNYLTSPEVWSEYVELWKYVFSSFYGIYFSLLVMIILLFSIRYQNSSVKRWIPVTLLIPVIVEFFYYAYIGRTDEGECPARCVYLVLMGFAMGGIVLSGVLEQKEKRKSITTGLLLLVLFTAVASQYGKDYTVNGLGLVNVEEINDQNSYLSNNDKIYICEYDARVEIEKSYGAWQTPPAGLLDHCILIGGWTIKHPMQNEQQISLGCANPYRALYEKENVYYIRKEYTEQSVLEYLRKNYDEKIDVEYIKEKGELSVFKYYLE